MKGISLIALVLSGEVGTRLWPPSRESHPKPFMKLADGQTLIEKTYARAKALGSAGLFGDLRHCANGT